MNREFTPLFSGGTGRSGTTSVVNLLSKHSLIHTSLPRELKYITDPYGLIDLTQHPRKIFYSQSLPAKVLNLAVAIQGRKPVDIFTARMRNRWWSETGKKGKQRGLIQGITQEILDEALARFNREFKSDRLAASRALYFELSVAQIKKEGVRYFADSTPTNISFADQLNKFLPDGIYINMVRDGRDVAMSVIKERWGPDDPYKALVWWKGRMLKGHQSLQHIPQERQLTLRLEDFIVNDREGSYSSLLQLLKLSDDSLMRKHFNENLLAEKMTNGSWKNSNLDIVKFEKIYKDQIAELADNGLVVEDFYA